MNSRKKSVAYPLADLEAFGAEFSAKIFVAEPVRS